jgi:hypothetical protein
MRTLLISLLLFSSIYHSFAQKTALIGEWETMDKKEKIKFELLADASGSFDGMPFLYEADNKQIITTYEYGVFHYEYELKNNQLILKEGNLEHPYVFVRKKNESPSTIAPTKKSIDPAIVGTWTTATSTFQFNGNGTMVSPDGKRKLFETKEGKLRIFDGNQVEENSYSVSALNLNLVANGQIVHLQKKSLEAGTNEINTIKTILPELTGKWCYISSASEDAQVSGECVILSHDGHYLFLHETSTEKTAFLDKGEWWANPGNLYFLAENGQTDTFRIAKKKHPALGYIMLNIDGRNFISADHKITWQ